MEHLIWLYFDFVPRFNTMIASIRNVESDVLTETLVINDAVGKIETLARLNRSIFCGGIFLNYIFIHKKSQLSLHRR